MPITTLDITDFRNIAKASLEPHADGLNVIVGSNGSGKTSLLEAIYYLSNGRSFRASTATRLIRHQAHKFAVFAKILKDYEFVLPIGAERDLGGVSKLRVAEESVDSIAELAACLPLRMINSQSQALLEGAPALRRRYLDWGLFYQADNFFSCWRQFERILKQRNALLKQHARRDELTVWNHELCKYTLVFNELRQSYVDVLSPAILTTCEQLLPGMPIDICYKPGWDSQVDYATVLEANFLDDLRYGGTQKGPHRAELEITIKGVLAKHFLSRGQQKLLICAMILAQGAVLAKYTNKGLIYLVDDLPAELDLASRQKLISLLSQQQKQVFVTAIERNAIADLVPDNTPTPLKVFHVEHGQVTSLE